MVHRMASKCIFDFNRNNIKALKYKSHSNELYFCRNVFKMESAGKC